jgi:hypothetical protein
LCCKLFQKAFIVYAVLCAQLFPKLQADYPTSEYHETKATKQTYFDSHIDPLAK